MATVRYPLTAMHLQELRLDCVRVSQSWQAATVLPRHTACGAHNYHLRGIVWYLTNPCFYHIVFTNAMEQSPCEADSSLSSEKVPRILCNPNAHCRTHNSSQLFPILNQIHPVHNSPIYLFKIHFNIIHNHLRIALPSDLRPFPHQNSLCISLPYVLHSPLISSPCFYCQKNI